MKGAAEIAALAEALQRRDGPQQALFAGEQSATADREALARALKGEKSGQPPEAIWKDTGWWRDEADKKWRYEIDDSKARLTPQAEAFYDKGNPGETMQDRSKRAGEKFAFPSPLPSFMQHDDLWKAYPDLAVQQEKRNAGPFKTFPGPGKSGAGIIYGKAPPTWDGAAFTKPSAHQLPKHEFEPGAYGRDQYIEMSAPNARDARDIGLHELQHALQNREGFTAGTDPSTAGTDGYLNNAGEVEARRVQARDRLSPEQRRSTPPWKTPPFSHPLQK